MDGAAPSAADQGVLALEEWEQPPRRQRDPGMAPVLSVEGFEGPLDWLLDLARTRRIDLARLSIVALVEAFAEALTEALAAPDVRPTLLARWGDWLVMAADLALLRSRLLAPADAAAAQRMQEAAELLRWRLLRRAEIGQAADWLEGRGQVGRDVFTRGQADGPGAVRAGRTGDITALLRACLAAIRLPADAAERYRVPGPPLWSPADAAARIRALLRDLPERGMAIGAFLPAVPAGVADRERRCRQAVASTFGAGLEMARGGELLLEQDSAWAPIQVRRGMAPVDDRGAEPAA